MTSVESSAWRFAAFADQVLSPAVYAARVPLSIGVHHSDTQISAEVAGAQEFRPISVGYRWGPLWSTAWFRLSGRIPEDWKGRDVVLRFSSGTESLLWRQGAPAGGLNQYHDSVPLFPKASGGEDVSLLIESSCIRPFGATVFWWDDPETRARWNEALPGRVDFAELTVYDEPAWRLWRTYDFARQIVALSPADSQRARQIINALDLATRAIDDRNPSRTADTAIALLQRGLRGDGPAAATRCFAVGHAHIDTAWLWPLRETRRKCLATFSTILNLMDRFAAFRFMCSQAVQYSWVEQDSPELFARIRERVADGRWEPTGAMWVEPDCNVPNGESLVRQILHGTRYWQSRFPDAPPQRLLYLPDTFGFPASLPQIAALAGVDTFITNKLCWSQQNEFPHVSFLWRGIDGTELVSHQTPGRDYNALNTPKEQLRGAQNAARLDQSGAGVWLQPFGHGDGGGGPTDTSILFAQLAEQCEPFSHTALAGSGEFCDALHERFDARRSERRTLPVWDGELYLEIHRGTYTAQAWLKHANRRAEQLLRAAEWLVCAGPAASTADRVIKQRAALDGLWKTLLLNQFHDILPGSSIGPVYDDARRDHAAIHGGASALIDEAQHDWASQANTRGMRRPMIVLNPASTARNGIVECEGESYYVDSIPSLGCAIIDRHHAVSGSTGSRHLNNGRIDAVIGDDGTVQSLRDCATGRDACADASPSGLHRGLNQLVLYEDRPRAWEAWDIDPEYTDKAWPVNSPIESRREIQHGTLMSGVEITRRLGEKSRITQTYLLAAGSPRLDIRTRVEWHEERRLLRALFPINVRSRFATHEIAFGHMQRPTHRSNPWDAAMFEVCTHRWMDLSEPGFGVALLNDGRYGHSCHDNVMGLSLLRSPKFPDAGADMGVHEFTYSLMPHASDWRAAGVAAEAEALNAPLFAFALPPGQYGAISNHWSPFEIETDAPLAVEVAAIKPVEDGDGLILRVVEIHGARGTARVRWNLPVTHVEGTDILERPLPSSSDSPRHDRSSRMTTIPIRPFQIVTLRARTTS